VFGLIESEGGLLQGGLIVQDCLTLLHNLIRLNYKNQDLFRESGGITKLSKLLSTPPKQTNGTQDDDWTSPEKDKNIWGVLSIMRLFLVSGSRSTQPNQESFYKNGLLQQIINMAFDKSVNMPTRAEVGILYASGCYWLILGRLLTFALI
jgi:intracellular protein transport protein USO1